MTEPAANGPARLTLGQTLGWALAFVVIAALIVLFFAFHATARPLLDVGAMWNVPWPLS